MTLHENEFTVDEAVVRRLLAGQFPDLANLPLVRVESSGTVNVLFRLGRDLVVRLPRIAEFGNGPAHEARWLPFFSDCVPLEIPTQVGLGSPTDEYPSSWSVMTWIDGVNATRDTLDDLAKAARQLGEFVSALRGADPAGGPDENYRGHGLAGRDDLTRAAVRDLGDEFEESDLLRVWEGYLAVPIHDGRHAWFHGDLHSGNLLAREGKLAAVIDFEGCSVGDPSSDLIAAWWLFDADSRREFRSATGADPHEWERGRGWALSVALLAVPYYRESNPVFADMARFAIHQILGES